MSQHLNGGDFEYFMSEREFFSRLVSWILILPYFVILRLKPLRRNLFLSSLFFFHHPLKDVLCQKNIFFKQHDRKTFSMHYSFLYLYEAWDYNQRTSHLALCFSLTKPHFETCFRNDTTITSTQAFNPYSYFVNTK